MIVVGPSSLHGQVVGIRLRRSGTPSPVRSARATLRPVIACIKDRSGPRTSGPDPCVQSVSVATRWMPAMRVLAPISRFEFL